MNKIFTARKRSLGQGNIFAPACHSVHRGWGLVLVGYLLQGACSGGGVPAPGGGAWWRPPWSRHPPRAGPSSQEQAPSPGSKHPPEQAPPGPDPPGWPLLRAVRILLECILVINYFLSKMGKNTGIGAPRIARCRTIYQHLKP